MFEIILAAVVVLFVIITVCLIGKLVVAEGEFETVERTGTIRRKRTEDDISMVFNGAAFFPIYAGDVFLFEMDDGEEVEVSEEDYGRLNVGDPYTYRKRVRRQVNTQNPARSVP